MPVDLPHEPLPLESCQNAFEHALKGRRNCYEPDSPEDAAYHYGAKIRHARSQSCSGSAWREAAMNGLRNCIASLVSMRPMLKTD